MDIKRSIKDAQDQLGIEKLRKHQVEPINNILDGHCAYVSRKICYLSSSCLDPSRYDAGN